MDPFYYPNIDALSDGSQLRIRSAQVEDAATYTCIATNDAGSAERNFNLAVLSA